MDTEVTVEITHREVTPGHITNASTEAHHATDTQTLIVTDGTHHIGGLPHIEALLCILETAVGLYHVLCTKLAKQHLLNLHTALTRQHGNTRIRNIKKVTIDDLPSDYYNSGEPSSDSEEDLS